MYLQTLATPEDVAAAAAGFFCECAKQAIATCNSFTLAILTREMGEETC